MKRRSDTPLYLGRIMPSKRLKSTQVLSQCAAMRGGTVQLINVSKPRWAGALLAYGLARDKGVLVLHSKMFSFVKSFRMNMRFH